GNNSYELVYQKYRGENLYQVKDVWFAGRENVYIISCWTLPLNYQKNENKFQVIIDSFTVL
ncbi:PsbP-related protein, partial [Methanobacterium sp.]